MPTIRKTISVRNTRTSMKLEAEFWDEIRSEAFKHRMRVSDLIANIDRDMPEGENLTAHVRLFMFNEVRRHRDQLLILLRDQQVNNAKIEKELADNG